MTDEIVTLKVRTTASFREKLALTAKENNRSMNAEIVDRLEKSFESDNRSLSSEHSINNAFGAMAGDMASRERISIAVAAALKALEENDQKKE